jgi:dTDP-4-amino-4,6-dideoxygalactose transaminase
MTSTTTTETTILPIDLAAERAAVGPALHEAVLRVIDSGRYVLGPEVEALERDFARMHGVAHGVGVATGTDALWLGLLAIGVKSGDHVVTSPFTFFASAASIALIGAKPVLADVDYETALLDPKKVEAAIDAKTTCILPVHLYGQLCDMRALKAIADKKQLKILEDGAQAHGARRDGYGCGGVGDAGTFSFYVTKNLGAAGEGGMVLTNSEATAKRLRELRDHGSPAKYVHEHIGTNSRLHALQAAILNVKMPHHERYDAAFKGSKTVVPMKVEANSTHAYHQYAVRIRGARTRDAVMQALAERKIMTAVHYPTPVHVQAAAKPWGYSAGDFPIAERLAREVLCLPIHPFLSNADVDRVAERLIDLARA